MSRVAVALCLSLGLCAQEEPAVVRAERFVKELELADKRGNAKLGLWQLGRDALPALSRAIRDPRIEVVEAACEVVYEMKELAAPLREQLTRELEKAEGQRKKALQWALCGASSTVIACASWEGEVVVLDRDGKPQGSHKGLGTLWGIQRLPNGEHLLARSGGDGGILQLDTAGNATKLEAEDGKKISPGGVLRVQRLLNGNTLAASGNTPVMEYDPKGRVVRTFATSGSAVTRLLNGHTLILDRSNGKVVEYDVDAKVVTSFEVPSSCFGMRRLPDGRTLVTDRKSDQVVAFDKKGAQVKTWSVLSDPNDVILLPDGTMVVGGSSAVAAYDRTGKQLWLHKLEWAGCLSR